MTITPYAYFQSIIAFLSIGLIILQTIIYVKEKDERSYFWSIIIGFQGMIFCFCEAYLSKVTYPPLGEIILKLEHTAICLYPISLYCFWVTFLKEPPLKKNLKWFVIIACICIFSIWFTPYHQSGEFILRVHNPNTIFRQEQWDFEEIGPFVIIEMLAILGAYIVLSVYLLKRKTKDLKIEIQVFFAALVLHGLFIMNDVLVWIWDDYNMFLLVGLGILSVLFATVYILASRQYFMYEEATRLNRQLDLTVQERTKELEALTKHLEERVQQRTDELMKKEAQMAQASKMESLGLLASGIAHDINNILMAITGNLQLVKMGNDPEQSITNALDACYKAKGLVERVYTFATQKGEKLHLDNFSNAINLSLSLFKSSSKFSETVLNEPDEPVFAYLESTSLVSLILNLLINAKHAMKEGGKITITYDKESILETTARPDITPGEYLHCTISDTGKGIPEETFSQVWKPYFTTKKVGEGTGLGLSMSKEIILDHGGDIWFDSELGKGTTFHILLKAGIPGISDEYMELQTKELPRKLNVMLVEDREDSQQIINAYLQSFGYSPRVFSNGLEAFNSFKTDTDSIDILLTDYALPEMNGIQLARECKKLNQDLPIIMFSGNIEQLPQENEVEGFLKKPFSPLDLRNMMLNILPQND